MERATNWLLQVQAVLRGLRAQRCGPRQHYTDATIALVYYWSVVNTRPQKWACREANWPLKRPPGGLPSPSQLSRRLHTPALERLLNEIDERVQALDPAGAGQVSVLIVDGHELRLSLHSRDRDAGRSFARQRTTRGYKLHLLIDAVGRRRAWWVGPVNIDERVVARRLLAGFHEPGYVLGDANYDDNPLHAIARARGLQLVAPRRRPEAGLGHRVHDPARLRCRDLLENTVSSFGRDLHAHRGAIERVFGTYKSTPELLTHLPAWVRGLTRVRRFVQAKLVLAELHRQERQTARNQAA